MGRRPFRADEAAWAGIDFLLSLDREAQAEGRPWAPGRTLLIIDVDEPPSKRRTRQPRPRQPRPESWAPLLQAEVARVATELARRRQSRDHLVLLLAAELDLRPAEIAALNLNQVRTRWGQRGKLIYLKDKLVRKRIVADALLSYRARDRESYLYPERAPLFRTGDKRMRTAAVQELVEGYIQRVQRKLAKGSSNP